MSISNTQSADQSYVTTLLPFVIREAWVAGNWWYSPRSTCTETILFSGYDSYQKKQWVPLSKGLILAAAGLYHWQLVPILRIGAALLFPPDPQPATAPFLDLEHREVASQEIIAKKLDTQLERAKIEFKKELKQSKPGLQLNASYLDSTSDTGSVHGLDYAVSHAMGRRREMEDRDFAGSIEIDGKIAPVFGIFDGHGGTGAADFVKENLATVLQEELKKRPSSDVGIWNALKQTAVRLHEEFLEKKEPSGTTAVIAMVHDGSLWVANIGDSRAILSDGEEVIPLTADMKPEHEKITKRTEKRGGLVIWRGIPRIDGILGTGAAIGDLNVAPHLSARPWITKYPLARLNPNAKLILVCDGITDVANSKQIAELSSQKNLEQRAQDIVAGAYGADSTDNLSAMIIQLFSIQKHPVSS